MLMSEDVLEQLRAAGTDPALLAEVQKGYMRMSDYTQKTQGLSQDRERLMYELGQRNGSQGSAPASKSKLDAFFEQLDDSEESRQARQILSGAFQAMREDVVAEQNQQLTPVVSHLRGMTQAQELDRRLESELVPMFGEGIRAHWGPLREQMLGALKQDQLVDPTGFVFRALPTEAPKLVSARMTANEQQKADDTGEGFARISTNTPSMSPSGAPAAPATPASIPSAPESAYRGRMPQGQAVADGGPRAPMPPTAQELQREFMSIASDVAAGNVREG